MSDDGEVGVSSIDVERHMTSLVPYVLQALTEGYGVIILNPDPMQNLVIEEPEEMPCVNSSAAIPEESGNIDDTEDMHRNSAVLPAGDPKGTANTPGNGAVIVSPGGRMSSSGRVSSGRMSYQDANDVFPSAHQVSPELRSAGSFRKKKSKDKDMETAKSKDAPSNKEGRPSGGGSYDPLTAFGSHGGKVKLDSKVIRKILNSHVAVAWQYLFPRSGADNISIVGFGDAHVSVWVLFACFGHVIDANLRGVVLIAMDDAENEDACSSPRPSDVLNYSPRGITSAAAAEDDDQHLSQKRGHSSIYNSATGQSAILQSLVDNEEAFSKLVLQKARLYEVQRLYATRCVLFAPSWWTVGEGDPLKKPFKQRPQSLTHDPRLEGNRSFENGSSSMMSGGGKMLVDDDSHNRSQLSCGWGLASRIGAGVFCGLRFRASDMRRLSRFERGDRGTNNNSFASFAGISSSSSQYSHHHSASGDFHNNLYQFNTMPSCARKILAQLRGKTIPKMGTRLCAHEAKVGCVCISSGEPYSENVRRSRQVHLHLWCTWKEGE
jgi:hypothetical protein